MITWLDKYVELEIENPILKKCIDKRVTPIIDKFLLGIEGSLIIVTKLALAKTYHLVNVGNDIVSKDRDMETCFVHKKVMNRLRWKNTLKLKSN